MANRPLTCPYYPCEERLTSVPGGDAVVCRRCRNTIYVRRYQGGPWLLTEAQVAAWDGRWDVTSTDRPPTLRRFRRLPRSATRQR